MNGPGHDASPPPPAADGGEVPALAGHVPFVHVPFERALFDAVPDPVTVLDWNGTVLAVNKAGVRAYQRPIEEIIGQPIEVLNPELPRGHMAPVWECLDRGETYVVEVTNMRADGTRFPVEVHSAGFLHDGRKAIVAVARDMSGRRDAELRYRELMETIDKGILVRDREGRIVHANAAAMRLFGIAPGQRADRALDDAQWLVVDEHGNELPRERYPASLALRTGQPVASMLLGFFNRERRTLTWLSATAVPQFEPGTREVHQVLSLFSDVTTLKRDSTLFDRVQALAHVGGWQWDAGRDRAYLTGEAQRVLGLLRPPATLADVLAGLRPPDRERLRTALQDTMRGGGPFDLELATGAAGSEPAWVRMIGEVEAGDPTGARLHGTVQDITLRKHTEESLRVQARTDPLTGLLNRDAVLGELETMLATGLRAGVAVLYIDLDRFKIVNDVLGHAAGDRVLVSAARRLQRAVGTEGRIARFGGDEFMVVCDATEDPDRPQRLARAILDAFGVSFRMDGEEFSITASIGIARAPLDGRLPQQLIQNADLAMYESKRRARNGWQAFSAEMAEQQLERLQLETQLRRAVENDEFHLVYQPQVDLATGRVLAAEALIRWRNAALGDMQPERFIAHAETTGDIVGIGSWVLHEACAQLRRWRDRGVPVGRISVNVSYRQFGGEALVRHVRRALDDAGLPGEALELEFTERVLIEEAPDTLQTFAALRDLGVMLTIDDFGEGYSALNYLRRLPIQGLKLSQQFLQGVPENASDTAICEAVAGIARGLKLRLVAEGVEHEAQRRFLLQLGVPVGQGFLFARGLQPDDLAERCRVGAAMAASGARA